MDFWIRGIRVSELFAMQDVRNKYRFIMAKLCNTYQVSTLTYVVYVEMVLKVSSPSAHIWTSDYVSIKISYELPSSSKYPTSD